MPKFFRLQQCSSSLLPGDSCTRLIPVLSHATYWEVKRRMLTHHTLHCSYLSKGYLPCTAGGWNLDMLNCMLELLTSSTILSLGAVKTGFESLKEFVLFCSIFNRLVLFDLINLLSILERALEDFKPEKSFLKPIPSFLTSSLRNRLPILISIKSAAWRPIYYRYSTFGRQIWSLWGSGADFCSLKSKSKVSASKSLAQA